MNDSITTYNLPADPDGMNDNRSQWAGIAITAFQAATGTDEEDALGDLLTDLMHWADRQCFDFEAALTRAADHYRAETGSEEASTLRFDLGQIVITTHARDTLTTSEILDGLNRHAVGDWGSICEEDAALNNEALQVGNRLLSAYGSDQRRFWIITEADRSVTTILMPEDY